MKVLVITILITNLLMNPVISNQHKSNATVLEYLEKQQSLVENAHDTVKGANEELQDMLLEHEKLLEERRHLEEERLQLLKENSILDIDYREELINLGYYRDDHKDKEINYRDSVLRFQSDHNLVVDGVFGSKSTEALYKRLQDENYQYPDIISKPPTDEKWIVVNKSKRTLTLYSGNKVLYKYPIAQGKSANLTPEGKFTIVTKIINPAWGGAGVAAPVAGGAPNNPLGTRWLGISHGGGGKYGVHGNSSPLSIGTNASLGCIRMINSDVEGLYNIIPIGTIIWIGTEDQLQEWGVKQTSYIEIRY